MTSPLQIWDEKHPPIDHCVMCKRHRATVDGLCDDCTIKTYGELFPSIRDKYKDLKKEK